MAPEYSQACRAAVDDLLARGGSLTAYRANPSHGVGPRDGSWAWRLEREIERRWEVSHAVAVSSGTVGLYAALEASGVQGGEVITSPVTFSATAAAIVHAGAVPVFADVDPQTGLMTAETVRAEYTCATRAILPVDLFGQVIAVDLFSVLDVPVIRDSCQAAGMIRGDEILSAAVYSFCATKQIPAGEGGCVVTRLSRLAQRLRHVINHGENFGVSAPGWNFRMNEVTACIAYHGLLELKPGTPYAVIDPSGIPYLDKHLGHYPAFKNYMRGPLPGADRFCQEGRIRYV